MTTESQKYLVFDEHPSIGSVYPGSGTNQLGEQDCFTADIRSKSHVRVSAINESPQKN